MTNRNAKKGLLHFPLQQSLFVLSSRINESVKEAVIKPSKVFPHNLRKLFARTFYGIEKDIAKLADILGHNNIDTTRIYIVTTGSEHRKKIERLGLIV